MNRLHKVVSGIIWATAILLVLQGPTGVSSVKQKGGAKPIAELVPVIECDVCKQMAAEAYDGTEELRKNYSASRKTVREEDIFEQVLDDLCNPYATQGHWIRHADIVAVTDVSASASKREFTVEFGSVVGKCRRECATVAETCVHIFDGETADALSSWLLKNKKSRREVMSGLCDNFCVKKRSRKTKKVDPRAASEEIEGMEDRELEIERMMDSMQKTPQGPGMQVFSRAEMMGLQDAMDEGDYDKAQELDPGMGDLSKEEFEMLRKMRTEESAQKKSTSEDDGEEKTQKQPQEEPQDQKNPKAVPAAQEVGANSAAKRSSLFSAAAVAWALLVWML